MKTTAAAAATGTSIAASSRRKVPATFYTDEWVASLFEERARSSCEMHLFECITQLHTWTGIKIDQGTSALCHRPRNTTTTRTSLSRARACALHPFFFSFEWWQRRRFGAVRAGFLGHAYNWRLHIFLTEAVTLVSCCTISSHIGNRSTERSIIRRKSLKSFAQ